MKTILIVEDVAFNLDLLVQLLEDDYTIHTATDGAAGRRLGSDASSQSQYTIAPHSGYRPHRPCDER